MIYMRFFAGQLNVSTTIQYCIILQPFHNVREIQVIYTRKAHLDVILYLTVRQRVSTENIITPEFEISEIFL